MSVELPILDNNREISELSIGVHSGQTLCNFLDSRLRITNLFGRCLAHAKNERLHFCGLEEEE